ncbi:MAG: type IV secretory system conjugative DNA transfer family protein [Anaerolineae bacterium]
MTLWVQCIEEASETVAVLGQDIETGAPVALEDPGRRQGTYVVGVTGTGKTTMLANIVLADIEAGEGVCLLDPHGDLTEDVLERIPARRRDDVILFDPADIEYPMGLNLFECRVDDPRQVDRVCSELVGTLRKLFWYSWGPRMEDLLRHSILTLIAWPGATFLDLMWLLTDEEFREEVVAKIKDPILRHFWRKQFPEKERERREWVDSSLNKIGRFLANPVMRNIISQPKSSFDVRQIMDEGKVLLVNLSKGRLGEDNSALLGAVLVNKILVAALERAELPPSQRRRFHLVVDEYQSFATETFPTLQSEARKYNIDAVVAHQYRNQLDDLNRGSTLNVGNLIMFRTTGMDGRELAAQFDNTPPEPELERQPMIYPTSRDGVYRTGDRQEFVLIAGKARMYSDVEAEMANRLTNMIPFSAYCKMMGKGKLEEYVIRTSPLAGRANPGMAEAIRQRSRRLGRPRKEVEADIEAKTGWTAPQMTYYDTVDEEEEQER